MKLVYNLTKILAGAIYFLMSKKIRLIILAVIFLASSWSLLITPKFFRVHDYTHGARIVEMTRALADGHFPVRWTKNLGYGFGMPLFEFYGPLPFYWGSLIYWLTGNLVWSLKSIILVANLATLVGGYLLGKKISESTKFSDQAGLFLAAAVVLAPYRAVNIFVRGAWSELWGLMFLVWLFWALLKLVRQEKGAVVWVSLFLAGVMLSHNLTILMALPFILIWVLINWGQLVLTNNQLYRLKNKFNWPAIGKLIGQGLLSAGLGLSLAAFYWLPAIVEKDLTKMADLILAGYFDYHLHFLYLRQFLLPNWQYGGSSWGPDDQLSFFLGFGQLAGLIFLSWGWIKKILLTKVKRHSSVLVAGWWLIGLFISLALAGLLTTAKTVWLWENIPGLSYLQFPWRFLTIICLLIAILISSLPSYWPQMKNKKIGWLILGLLLINGYFFRPEKYLEQASSYYYADQQLIRTKMSQILPDYIPAVMAEQLSPSKDLIADLAKDQFQILVDQTHQKLVKLNLTRANLINLNLADYPGWEVYLDGLQVAHQTGKIGNIQVDIPAGQHRLGIKFNSTPVRSLADWISLISWLGLIGYLFYQGYQPNHD